MIKSSRLPIYTFIAVFVSITLVGLVVVPILLDILLNNYLRLQSDVNYRQARTMAQFIQKQIENGRNPEDVISDFQASIEGTQFDRGYVCVVDQKTTNLLSHPMKAAVGMNIAERMAILDENFNGKNLKKWEEFIQSGKSGGGLLLVESEKTDEVVYLYSIQGVNWTVSSHENKARIESEISEIRDYFIIGSFIFALVLAIPISFAVRKVNKRYEDRIINEQQKSEKLLLNILPQPIAERMKNQEKYIVDHFAQVSVLFCDIVGFTIIASKAKPEQIVKLLNKIFSEFDTLSEKYGVEKIKTIGDAYMAVSGIPEEKSDHANPIALMALEMLQIVQKIHKNLHIRVGIHSGEVVAGVIGKQKFSYDLWGDTVNTASRLESHGKKGKIHCSEATYELLKDKFEFEDNGVTELKGKGKMNTYFIIGKKENPAENT